MHCWNLMYAILAHEDGAAVSLLMTVRGLLQAQTPASRARFNTKAFAQKNSLGDPVQALYFTVAASGFE